jgi:hypothetical protein
MLLLNPKDITIRTPEEVQATHIGIHDSEKSDKFHYTAGDPIPDEKG